MFSVKHSAVPYSSDRLAEKITQALLAHTEDRHFGRVIGPMTPNETWSLHAVQLPPIDDVGGVAA